MLIYTLKIYVTFNLSTLNNIFFFCNEMNSLKSLTISLSKLVKVSCTILWISLFRNKMNIKLYFIFTICVGLYSCDDVVDDKKTEKELEDFRRYLVRWFGLI